MYEGDTPNAERRAAALSLDRDLLRELLGQEELRELIDPGALERVEDDLQRRSEITRATGRDAPARRAAPRRRPDRRGGRASACSRGSTPPRCSRELERERRAIRLRIGGEERYVAADDAGLYRDALGAVPPGGLPEAFLDDVPDALRELVARYARTHGPFTTDELHARYGVDASAVLRELERAGELVRGELRPGGSEREWCDVEVLRRLRRASLAALRKEIEPADQRALAAFLPVLAGRRPPLRRGRRRASTACARCSCRSRAWRCPPRSGSATCCRAAPAPTRRRGSTRSARAASSCGSAPARSGGSGRVALYFREDAPLLGPPPAPRSGRGEQAAAPSAPRARAAARAPRAGPLLLHRPARRARRWPPRRCREALWDLVWAGEVTNDAWAPLRAPRLTLARGARAARGQAHGPRGRAPVRALDVGRSRFGARRTGAQAQVQGRWSLTEPLFGAAPAASAAARSPSCCSSATGSSPASRCSPRGSTAASRCCTTRSATSRRSACAAAATSSRVSAARSSRSPAPSSGCAPRERASAGRASAARARARRRRPRPALRRRAAVAEARRGRTAVPRGWPAPTWCWSPRPVLYVERGGRGLVTLTDAPLGEALQALAEAVRAGRVGKLALERIDGEPAIASPLAEDARSSSAFTPVRASSRSAPEPRSDQSPTHTVSPRAQFDWRSAHPAAPSGIVGGDDEPPRTRRTHAPVAGRSQGRRPAGSRQHARELPRGGGRRAWT